MVSTMLPRFVSLTVTLVILGITTSSACKISEVFDCVKAYKGPDGRNLDLKKTCKAVQDTQDCLTRVTQNCQTLDGPKVMLGVIMPTLKKALDACKSPGSDENSAILACNKVKDPTCDIAQTFELDNRGVMCKLLTKMSKCTAVFKQKCTSKILNILDGLDQSTVDIMKSKLCPSSACTPRAVLQCLAPYKGQDLDFDKTCRGAMTTYTCLTRTSSNCNTQTQVTVGLSLGRFKKAVENCHKIDLGEIEAITECYGLKNSNCAKYVAGSNSTCQSLKKGLDCYTDFQSKCLSSLLQSLATSSQIVMNSQLADMCASGHGIEPTIFPLLVTAVIFTFRYFIV